MTKNIPMSGSICWMNGYMIKFIDTGGSRTSFSYISCEVIGRE